jgi:hypothetical protein
MTSSNRPITAREYKLILNSNNFEDKVKGLANFVEVIRDRLNMSNIEGAYFEEQSG